MTFTALDFSFMARQCNLCPSCSQGYNPANIYLFKVNSKISRKRCEICSKLTMKTPERGQ